MITISEYHERLLREEYPGAPLRQALNFHLRQALKKKPVNTKNHCTATTRTGRRCTKYLHQGDRCAKHQRKEE